LGGGFQFKVNPQQAALKCGYPQRFAQQALGHDYLLRQCARTAGEHGCTPNGTAIGFAASEFVMMEKDEAGWPMSSAMACSICAR